MRKDRFIVGIICVAISVWLLVTDTADDSITPTVAIAILGITMIGISRKK